MFTDMVGYSALVQKNETLALELLEEHRRLLRPLFPKHGGREIETAGDAFFVEFESALHATRCAVEIQKTLHERNAASPSERSIVIRIGLHLGDVEHIDEHVHGDGVNIAARIEPLAKPGGILVSEAVQREVQNKLGLPIVKLGAEELKNIRLPMNLYRVALPWEKQGRDYREWLSYVIKLRSVQIGTAAAIVLAAALAIYSLRTSHVLSTGKTSLAVLPIKNVSGDPEEEYLPDGITEDITSQLSNSHVATVISSRSAFYFRKPGTPDSAIASQLGVRFLLHGSMKLFPHQIRIDVTLFDSTEKKNVWQDSYDVPRDEIISARDTVVSQLIRLLSLDGESIRRNSFRPPSQAYLSYLQGLHYRDKSTREDNILAIRYLEDALRKDSSFVKALGSLADAELVQYEQRWNQDRTLLREAQTNCERALKLDPENSASLGILGFVKYCLGDSSDGLNLMIKATNNPNNVAGLTRLGIVHMFYRGDLDNGIIAFKKAREIEPLDWMMSMNLGIGFFGRKQYTEAINAFRRSIELNPGSEDLWHNLGYAFSRTGQYDSAVACYTESLRRNPSYVRAYNGMATVLLLRHQFARAESLLTSGLQHLSASESKHELLYALGLTYMFTGRQSSAKSVLTEGLQFVTGKLMKNRGECDYYAYCALFHARLGHKTEAIRSAREATQCDSTTEESRIKLTRIFAVLGDKTQMQKWFRLARAMNPSEYDESYLSLAIDFERYRNDPEMLMIAKQ